MLACTKCPHKPAKGVQTHSRQALLSCYVTIMNNGPGRGVDTKHGVVTLLLWKKYDALCSFKDSLVKHRASEQPNNYSKWGKQTETV